MPSLPEIFEENNSLATKKSQKNRSRILGEM